MEKTKKELLETIANLESHNAELQKRIKDYQHMAKSIEAKDQEISSLSQTIGNKFQKQLDEKENIIKGLVGFIQAYQQTYRSFLKNVQGGLENAVELEALLSEKLAKK